jgi:DNA-directed RNA polymerase I, II, and III subunit RPABC2
MSDIEDNDYASESESETEMDRRKPRKQVKSAIGKPKTTVLSDNEDEESDVAASDSDEDVSIADSKDDSDIDDMDPEEMDENAIFADVVKSKNAEDDEFQFGFNSEDEDDSDLDEDEDGARYLQKLDESVKEQTIANHHPELIIHNYDEVEVLTTVVRNEHGIIVDPLHRTLPFLSKYERTRILGERAKQINDGARPFVTMDPSVIDGYLIALKELEERKLPFIIRRPLSNGGSEYWKLKDLEFII